MHFPETIYGSRASLETSIKAIEQVMKQDEEMACRIRSLSRELQKTYLALESYFKKYTEPFCSRCDHPCCVNRHGFPDFEDLVVFSALGTRLWENFDFSAKDRAPCQFLGKDGCTLERCNRSYRCTWYFCDEVFERFRAQSLKDYEHFEILLDRLGKQRMEILELFDSAWKKK